MNEQIIIKKEEQNRGTINLYLEGLFWKAYQYSAFLLVQQGAQYKANRRPVKSIRQEVVSVCFPKDTLPKLFKAEQIEPVSSKQLRIGGFILDRKAYDLWFASLPVQEKKASTQKSISADDAERVFNMLQNIRVEESTPLDCMRLIIKVQKILDGCL